LAEVAPENMKAILVTLDVFQPLVSGFAFGATLNMLLIVVTLEVFQPLVSGFAFVALLNIVFISVTLLVFQLPLLLHKNIPEFSRGLRGRAISNNL